MFAYKTNSSDYLDYVASVKTREQILADPDLCLLLQNPFIKDNTEMAIRWNKAKHGSYQDKYDFMEYLMCNGPQLDADTILHYRAKAYSDPVCMEIAYSYLSDVEYISQVREQKYGKETDNCFKNPCFYMGKFSAMMGNCGDTENTRTAFNCIARWWHAKFGDGKEQEIIQAQQINNGQRVTNDAAAENKARAAEEEARKKAGQTDAKPLGTDTKVKPAGNASVPNAANPTIQPAPPPGMIRKCFMQVLHPSIAEGWGKWWSQVSSAGEAFSEDFMKCTNTALMAGKIGDYLSQPVSEMLDMVTKANVKRQLGDCARLWSHVRRFRLFGSDNKYGPVVANQLVGDTNTDGTPTETVANPQPKAGDSTKPLKRRNKKKKKKKNKKGDTALQDPFAPVVIGGGDDESTFDADEFDRQVAAGAEMAGQMVDQAVVQLGERQAGQAFDEFTASITKDIVGAGKPTISQRVDAQIAADDVRNQTHTLHVTTTTNIPMSPAANATFNVGTYSPPRQIHPLDIVDTSKK